jgi:uncharacterized membrane protein
VVWRRPRAELAACGVAAVATVGLAWASLYRHERFGSNAYDLGLFDQTVWGYSRFELLPNTVMRLPNPMGFHFHPIIMSLAPLYWLWDDARVLLIAQAALIAVASIPLFLYARRRLATVAALLFQAAYLVFWGVLGANLFDFHEVAFAAPLLSLALYAYLTRNDVLLLVSFALGLLTREDLALTFAALGLLVAVAQRRVRLGLAMTAVSLTWFVIAVDLIVPHLAGGSYPWQYQSLGGGPGEAAAHLLRDPLDTIEQFFTPRDKQIALFNLLVPWLGLWVLSPLGLLTLPTLAERFLSDNPSHWAPQGFHYSLVLAPLIAFAAVDATARLAPRVPVRLRTAAPVVLAGGTLAVGVYFSFVRLEPLDELRRLTPAARVSDIRACLRTVPTDASVAATSALVPHLSQRQKIFVLDDRPIPQTDVYAVDLSTWTFPFGRDDVSQLVAEKRRGGYGVRCSRGSIAVLERGAPDGRLSPELATLLAAVAQP